MNIPWITCQKGSKTYLLARDQKSFYLIDVDRRLDHATEEWLAENGISDRMLQELALTYQRISADELHGVGIGGVDGGDSVYLYLKSGKRQQHILTLDYAEEDIDDFFGGMPRFLAPEDKKRKRCPDGWRKENRDPKRFSQLSPVGFVLTAVCGISSFGYLILDTWPWYLISVLCLAATVALDILFPAYFTLQLRRKGEKSVDAWDLTWPWLAHGMVIVLDTHMNWLNDGVFFLVLAVCGLGMLLLLLLAEEFKRDRSRLWEICLIAAFIGVFSAGHMNEAFDFSEPKTYTLQVEELTYSRSRRSRDYDCTVTLPDGRSVDIDISGSLYNELEVGDYVRVEHSVGALGIEYVNAYPLE